MTYVELTHIVLEMHIDETVDWLFVDLNSYFASVEQQLKPRLRNKPIAVVAVLAETTSVIAASYPAKAFGVKTGTRVFEARRLCPGIEFVKADHKLYVDYHHRIVEAVESCLHVSVVGSIDEMAARLTGSDRKIEKAIEIAREVKQKIRNVGSELGSSVGLAPNRYLAKVAADMQKPDGLTIIKRSDIPKRFLGLNIRDFPGVGSNMERRLQSAGIYSVEQLYSCDIRKLRTVWNGVMGERIYGWIRGQDFEMSQDKNQSIGHSHVLAPHLRTEEGARAVAMKLLHKAAYRLRKINCWAKKLSLNVSFENQTSWSEHVRMHECQDSLTLGEIFQTLWKKKAMGVPFKVSLTLSELVSENDRNGSFFENKKRVDLSRAMDNLNNKYNKNLIYLAGEDDTQFAAPSRIAFSNIPTFDNE